MNPNERNTLSQFLDQLVQTRGITKNNDADFMIRTAIGQQPDAAYLLVQRCLLQDQALQQAQQRIKQLQEEIQTLKNQFNAAPTTQQGNFFGGHTIPSPSYSAPANTFPSTTYTNSHNNSYAKPASPWTGFLANAATTAAGVAGGAFLYQGLTNLFSDDDQQASSHQAAVSPTPQTEPEAQETNFFDSFSSMAESNESSSLFSLGEDSAMDIGADDFMNS